MKNAVLLIVSKSGNGYNAEGRSLNDLVRFGSEAAS